ncbi:MAG: hypothetical protein AAB575_01115 [Patescibacteria group bacterium]
MQQMLSLSTDNWQEEIQRMNLPEKIIAILLQAIKCYLSKDDSSWPNCNSEELHLLRSQISFILIGEAFLEPLKSNNRLVLY